MSEKEVIFEMDGFQIKTNSLYKITQKPDPNAPSGLLAEGTTKIPSEGVGNTVQCRYHIIDINTKSGVWDTGFYQESPCYFDKDRKEVERIVSTLNKYIVTPFKLANGKQMDLDHTDNEFWDNKNVNLYAGRVFNTSKIGDLLDLYLALTNLALTPKGKEGNSRYRGSDYCIEDSNKAVDYKKEKANDKVEAFSNFVELRHDNKKLLLNLLHFIGVTVSEKIDDSTLSFTFNEYLEGKVENAKDFNDGVLKLKEDPRFETRVAIYKKLGDIYKKGSVTKATNGKYYFRDKEIGESLRQASENLVIQEELKELKQEILDIE